MPYKLSYKPYHTNLVTWIQSLVEGENQLLVTNSVVLCAFLHCMGRVVNGIQVNNSCAHHNRIWEDRKMSRGSWCGGGPVRREAYRGAGQVLWHLGPHWTANSSSSCKESVSSWALGSLPVASFSPPRPRPAPDIGFCHILILSKPHSFRAQS